MITIKNKQEIAVLRRGGKKLAMVMEKLKSLCRPGASTAELEDCAVGEIRKIGGRPSFLQYRSCHETNAYPTALCVSINEEIVHAPALPARILRAGDIVGLDIGMEYPWADGQSGLYTDMAATVPVGQVSEEAKKLIALTEKSLRAAIAVARPGAWLFDIGRAVEKTVAGSGFSIVRDLVGHGVGYAVHEEPNVPNYVPREKNFFNLRLKSGMVLALEPMINAGGPEITLAADGFTIRTADGRLSAHFEHTIALTADVCRVITSL